MNRLLKLMGNHIITFQGWKKAWSKIICFANGRKKCYKTSTHALEFKLKSWSSARLHFLTYSPAYEKFKRFSFTILHVCYTEIRAPCSAYKARYRKACTHCNLLLCCVTFRISFIVFTRVDMAFFERDSRCSPQSITNRRCSSPAATSHSYPNGETHGEHARIKELLSYWSETCHYSLKSPLRVSLFLNS